MSDLVKRARERADICDDAARDWSGVKAALYREDAALLRELADEVERAHKMRAQANSEWRLAYNALFQRLAAFTRAAEPASAALEWALDLLDMYDAKLIELGEPADRVNNAVHTQGKANARSDLRALARACSDAGNVRDDEVRAKGPADRAPEAGEKPAQDE